MKIALISAIGNVGRRLVAEAPPACAALETSRANAGTPDWTFLSPSVFFGPGERTGGFRLGTDALVTAEDGKSHISHEDYAVALLGEVETPRQSRQRFTVEY